MHIFSPPLARPQWPQLFQENLRVGSGVGSPRWADLFQSEMPAELLSAGGRRPSFPGATLWQRYYGLIGTKSAQNASKLFIDFLLCVLLKSGTRGFFVLARVCSYCAGVNISYSPWHAP